MFPLSHDLHDFARQHQREILAEAERARLTRHAVAAARPAAGNRASFAAVRSHLAAALYALAEWLDASQAVGRSRPKSALEQSIQQV